MSAGGSTYIFFDAINHAIFKVLSGSGNGQYFGLPKVGKYRIILHVVATGGTSNLTLDLKNSDNSTTFKKAYCVSNDYLEIAINNTSTSAYYLLNLKSSAAVTLWADSVQTWAEIEYLGV